MTFSKPSDPGTPARDSDVEPATEHATPGRSARSRGDDTCPKCGGPLRTRNARPFPVALQSAFGISFIAFLVLQGNGRLPTPLAWAWSAAQIALGALLIRARFASAKKVFICLRCGATLG